MEKAFWAHNTAIIDDNAEIGSNTKIWQFCNIMVGAKIGADCQLGQNVFVESGVVIGNHVKIKNNIAVYTGVKMEDYVFCGPSVVFTNVINPRSKYPKEKNEFKKTIVKEGATLGANCTIVCGNIVGRWSFIAAGAVVTKNVKDHALMIGVPAKQCGWVCECGEKLEENLFCKKCGRKYCESDNGLSIVYEGEER